MHKKAFDLQMYTATKELFRAVANGKSLLVYGPYRSGKSSLVNDNQLLLRDYEHMYIDLSQISQLKKILNKNNLFVAEGVFDGRKLHLPKDNIVEIHLPLSLENTNELSYT